MPTGEEFVLEMTLETRSFNERRAGLFDAAADFFSTAGLSVSTKTAGVVFEEVIADSTFEVTAIRVQDGQVELTWESYPGRKYTLERAGSPLGAWEVLRRDIEAAPDPNNRTLLTVPAVAEGGTAAFFRVLEQP